MKENKITCSKCGTDITNIVNKQLKKLKKENEKFKNLLIEFHESLNQKSYNEEKQCDQISGLKTLLEAAKKENLELQNKIKSEAEKEQKTDEILKIVNDLKIKFLGE